MSDYDEDLSLLTWFCRLQRSYRERTGEHLEELRLPADVWGELLSEVVGHVLRHQASLYQWVPNLGDTPVLYGTRLVKDE